MTARARENLNCEKAFLTGIVFDGPREVTPFKELGELADTAGARVVGTLTQRRESPDRATYLGKGKATELAAAAKEAGAHLILVDADLSPAQVRNLEKVVDLRVVDRTELILDIFASHARTKQSKLQVELAQMEYLLPRLKRMWVHLGRIEGGIGMRGPGEKQLEVDRRVIGRKIAALQRQLSEISVRKEREVKTREDKYRAAIVGYTNAGKSTLMNRLTGAGVREGDQLFLTLDTKTVWWPVGGWGVFLSDTVGFIRKLPHHLVASFHATLEEARQADLLLHVIDATDPEMMLKVASVEEVLARLGMGETPRIRVFNKIDLPHDRAMVARMTGEGKGMGLKVSAVSGEGIPALAELVLRQVLRGGHRVLVKMPHGAGDLLAWLSRETHVMERNFRENGVEFTVLVDDQGLSRLKAEKRCRVKALD